MKTNELRIGSHYSYDNDAIKLDGSLLATYLQNDTDLYLYPIPLTEEWLLDFGFENENYGWNIKEFGIFDHNYKNGKSLRLALNASPVPVFIIRYVHQLQNLYFSLAGEELKIIRK